MTHAPVTVGRSQATTSSIATAKCGSLAWEKYGLKGIRGRSFPAPGEVVADGNVSYHLRVGKHDLTLWDWNRYMDFADAHGWSRAVPAADGRIEKRHEVFSAP